VGHDEDDGSGSGSVGNNSRTPGIFDTQQSHYSATAGDYTIEL
jgi:hypothetical protein